MDNQQIHDSIKGIAVIGMSGRFPKAKNIDEFWHNLCNGQESISFFSDEELEDSGIDPASLHDPQYVKAGARLSDIEMFDASFFDVSPREAEIIDPQHRFLLESAWEALENAGYDPGAAKDLTGIYVGTNLSIYMLSKLGSNPDIIKSMGSSIFFSNVQDFAATRVSYKLNLKGPSINISTACSTSLVAVHLACQGLLNYECDLALAGGVSIQSLQKQGYFYQEGGITSPDGRCRAFDAKAQGTIFGDGIGIVVLKRLEDAFADGDCIHAVIKSSAINNDGAAKVGYTAPSVGGQTKVIVEAQANAGFNPETITYIEAHGTGTSLGDPIEISALKKTFEARTNKKQFCAIGSVKPNIGHLNIASGVTGLIKTVMALKHNLIPPSLHFEQPNPEIDFANSPFYVNTKLSEWKTNGTPRRAGVSSFGVGGTNAHVILEEAPIVQPSSTSRHWQLLLLSAKTTTALETTTASLVAHLQQHPDLNLPDVAHTLQLGRRAFDHRRMVVCHNQDDVVKVLTFLDPQRVFTYHQKPTHSPVIFMFSGQGAQYVEMGRELYQVEPTFRTHLDTCAQILQT
ncbi:MAG: type I polyketide synthase, partial [Nostoc sp.]